VPDVPEMQSPVFAVKNAARRWATTVNYDLLIYDDRILVARGLSYRDAAPELGSYARETRAAARTRRETGIDVERVRPERPFTPEVHEARVQSVASLSVEEVLSKDAGNRLIWSVDIAVARLTRWFGICTFRLKLLTGERLKYMWMDSAKRAAAYAPAKEALQSLLGYRLRA
jgi:hypothetical protein